MEVQSAFAYLLDAQNFKVPHDAMPILIVDNEAEWNAYAWNPPVGYEDMGVDPNAAAKPTWQELVDAFHAHEVYRFKEDMSKGLRVFTQSYISVHAYGAKDSDHEKQIKERLTGDSRLNRMNEYKEFYRTRHHEIKHWVNQLSEDAVGSAKVQAWFDASIDISNSHVVGVAFTPGAHALYSGATWTPPGEASPFADHANVPTYEYIHHENPPPTTTESSL